MAASYLSVRSYLVWSILGLLLVAAACMAVPWNSHNLRSEPHPSTSYTEALQQLEVLSMAHPDLRSECGAKLLTHGAQVERVIVLVHGYTSCPQQFAPLGQELFEQGYNVLMAPLPHHGLPDRMNTEQAELTAEELVQYTDKVVDIAQGLGTHVTVAGISGGGAMTAWATQNRNDVDLALLISPLFGFKEIPAPLTAVVMNAFRLLPNRFEWWDPEEKDHGGISYAYPQYSTRALAQFLRLGYSVRRDAASAAPAAQRIIVATNGDEPSVNNQLTLRVANLWLDRRADVSSYEFPADMHLPHDLIDPNQPEQKTNLVYPVLVQLLALEK